MPSLVCVADLLMRTDHADKVFCACCFKSCTSWSWVTRECPLCALDFGTGPGAVHRASPPLCHIIVPQNVGRRGSVVRGLLCEAGAGVYMCMLLYVCVFWNAGAARPRRLNCALH